MATFLFSSIDRLTPPNRSPILACAVVCFAAMTRSACIPLRALFACAFLAICVFRSDAFAAPATTNRPSTLDAAIDLALRSHPAEARGSRANVDVRVGAGGGESGAVFATGRDGEYQRLTANPTHRPRRSCAWHAVWTQSYNYFTLGGTHQADDESLSARRRIAGARPRPPELLVTNTMRARGLGADRHQCAQSLFSGTRDRDLVRGPPNGGQPGNAPQTDRRRRSKRGHATRNRYGTPAETNLANDACSSSARRTHYDVACAPPSTKPSAVHGDELRARHGRHAADLDEDMCPSIACSPPR